ncbi:LysR family transcriptional regulator [Enhydrobacter sp. 8BJ]|nr:LysR substrate-binding domain-containing protein [Enhydrobacter sp. 8BJ]VXB12813.1 LysR family transcriptional regulator [Enhydrobacter sp. 8BJ]
MRRQIPSLQSLLCFESVAKHLSYTYAAQELFITQSAVSRQIQQLEAFLSVELFTRTRYGVELTQVGKQYAENIRPFLKGLEASTSDIINHKGGGGILRLGVVPSFATRWLLPKLPALYAIHPEITIRLETNTKPFLFNEKKFDAAIFAGTQQQISHWPGIVAHELMQEELVAVCAPSLLTRLFPSIDLAIDFTLTDEQLLSIPLLQQTTRPDIWQEWFDRHHISHPRPYDGQSQELFSMLAETAVLGMGMALIPKLLIENELLEKTLIIVSNKQLKQSRSYYVIHHNPASSPLIDKFVTWLKSYD